MFGHVIWAETATERVPGQVPQRKFARQVLDPEVDPARRAPEFTVDRYFAETGPVLSPAAVTDNLGLPLVRAKGLSLYVKNQAGTSMNEVEFRRSIMSKLLDDRYEAQLRRQILHRAVSYYRQRMRKSTSSDEHSPELVLRATDPSELRDDPDRYLGPPGILPIQRYDVTDRPERGKRPEGEEAEDEVSIDLFNDENPRVPPLPAVYIPAQDETYREETSKASARGGKYYKRVKLESGKYKYFKTKSDYDEWSGAHVSGARAQAKYLRGKARRLLESNSGGCPLEKFRDLVSKYGAKKVASAIRGCGEYEMKAGKVCLKSQLVIPEDTYQVTLELRRGAKVAPAGAGGAGGGSVGTPPGTKKIWGNRVVQKQPDGRWKVISHVAGMEGQAVPRDPRGDDTTDKLDPKQLTREQAQHLIDQLKEHT